MNKAISNLVQKEMTRKEFLATLGFGALSIMGFGSIIKFLSGNGSSAKHSSSGYGSSAYGGNKD